jgi:FADH2 O2-dependent halogenase
VKSQCDVAIVGSGFAGSLLARVLTRLGYEVSLLERGTHPRFAIGESSTPLANLSLERLGRRYGMDDCFALSSHGRWLESHRELRRGLKRGFTFYRHHPGEAFADRGLDSERLLVAASPHDFIADTHWFRADVDHHFVREAISAGVDYRDRAELTNADFSADPVRLSGNRDGEPFEIRTSFLIDASGPGGFLARQLAVPSALSRTHTRAGLVYSHFDNVRLMHDVLPGLPEGPYPDDWAAVHHLIDEGWMYSLRFDHGTTSAGFLLRPDALEAISPNGQLEPELLWRNLLARYPTLERLFADARPTMPFAYRPLIQHRLSQGAGERWLMMPHAYAFVDPLFSTGIAWSLRAVERLALVFEDARSNTRTPGPALLDKYSALLTAEADQIDLLVAGAYKAMQHFDLFAAQAMLYFTSVSFAEASQRLVPDDDVAWRGFLGVGDPVLGPLPAAAFSRLSELVAPRGGAASWETRSAFGHWISEATRQRNVAALSNPSRKNLYPVDFDALVDAHAILGLTREEVESALPALRGSPRPAANLATAPSREAFFSPEKDTSASP